MSARRARIGVVTVVKRCQMELLLMDLSGVASSWPFLQLRHYKTHTEITVSKRLEQKVDAL